MFLDKIFNESKLKKKEIFLPCPTHCVKGREWVFWEEAKKLCDLFLASENKSLSEQPAN